MWAENREINWMAVYQTVKPPPCVQLTAASYLPIREKPEGSHLRKLNNLRGEKSQHCGIQGLWSTAVSLPPTLLKESHQLPKPVPAYRASDRIFIITFLNMSKQPTRRLRKRDKLKETKVSKQGKTNPKGNRYFKEQKEIEKYLSFLERRKILLHHLTRIKYNKKGKVKMDRYVAILKCGCQNEKKCNRRPGR